MTENDNVETCQKNKIGGRGKKESRRQERQLPEKKKKEPTFLILYILINSATGFPCTNNYCAQYINPSVPRK